MDAETGLEVEFVVEVEVEVQLEPELATAVSLVALAPVHLLVDPGVGELETVGHHAGYLEESSGGHSLQ